MWAGISFPNSLNLLNFNKQKIKTNTIYRNDILFLELFKFFRKILVQNIINEDTISAYGVKILFIDKKLLKIDDEYWSNDICPNLNWTFASPNVIFSSFRIDMNGRLYQGKSSWCFENINKQTSNVFNVLQRFRQQRLAANDAKYHVIDNVVDNGVDFLID